MRALEEDVGVRLLARTTRSVSLTEAGEQLLGRLRPALTEVGETLEEISGRRDKAAGRIRLLLPRLAIRSVLAPKLGKLSREYPDIILDVTTDDSRRDIVGEGFDAGIHSGEYIHKDMIAVRVSPDHRPAIVGSPAYFEAHPRPKVPRDLLQHRSARSLNVIPKTSVTTVADRRAPYGRESARLFCRPSVGMALSFYSRMNLHIFLLPQILGTVLLTTIRIQSIQCECDFQYSLEQTTAYEFITVSFHVRRLSGVTIAGNSLVREQLEASIEN